MKKLIDKLFVAMGFPKIPEEPTLRIPEHYLTEEEVKKRKEEVLKKHSSKKQLKLHKASAS